MSVCAEEKSGNPARIVAGEEVDRLVVESQEAQVELRDDEVLVVARVADQGALRQRVGEFVEFIAGHRCPRDRRAASRTAGCTWTYRGRSRCSSRPSGSGPGSSAVPTRILFTSVG